ncbi:MAG: hypothetical protein QXX68_00710 [Candidatus Pacearchaeota archaeon]
MLSIKKMSKPIEKISKGDFVFVDGHKLIVLDHFVFMEYKDTKEMIIELENEEKTKKYQLRYFNDQLETSIEFYYLMKNFQYVKVDSVEEVWW